MELDFEYTDDDRDSALTKMTVAALKYDKSHPAAMSLDGFECRSLTPVAFKEILRATFNLRLQPKEAAALVDHFGVQREEFKRQRDNLSRFLDYISAIRLPAEGCKQ